jgi:branched-chain amino acid transport system ATP-binding protein
MFGDMSVIDTVKVAASAHVEYGLLQAFLHTAAFWQAETRLDDYCFRLLKIFNLHRLAAAPANSLPYAQQRRLEIVRALACAPKLLLLDEPAAGMNPQETRELIETIRRVRGEFELTILIIEHNMNFIMTISDRIVVVDFGETIAQGRPEEIKTNSAVIAAYLGSGSAHAAYRGQWRGQIHHHEYPVRAGCSPERVDSLFRRGNFQAPAAYHRRARSGAGTRRPRDF